MMGEVPLSALPTQHTGARVGLGRGLRDAAVLVWWPQKDVSVPLGSWA